MNSAIPATAGFSDKIASGILTGLNKLPYLKKKLASPKAEKITKKVIHIAIELFKGIGVMFVGTIFGALAGLSFGGPIPIAIGAVAGGLSAGIAFFGTKCVMMVINRFAYPSNRYLKEKANSVDTWRDDKHYPEFVKTLETFQNEDWYKSWLTLKKYKKCNNFLWRNFGKGFCYGETQSLIDLVKTKHDSDTKDLLNKLEAKEIFKKQILEIIRTDFASILKKNKSAVIRKLNRSDLEQQLAKLTKEAKQTTAHKYASCHFDKDNLTQFANFKQHLHEYTKQLKGKHPHFVGTIRLEGCNKAHTLFVQYEKGHYRMYDGYHSRHTGFYEFPDKASFLKGLHSHLRAYAKIPNVKFQRYKRASIQFYGF